VNKLPKAIENELKIIEKFKEKQKIELQALIHANLSDHINIKKNEEKSKIIIQKSLEKGLFNNTTNQSI
jgi:hypothetical protein